MKVFYILVIFSLYAYVVDYCVFKKSWYIVYGMENNMKVWEDEVG